MTEQVVGVVGLGNMGGRIARRLSESMEVAGYDRDESVRARSGLPQITPDLAELAVAADVICLSLPTARASVDVVSQIANMPERRVTSIVELSTAGLTAVAESSERAAAVGLRYIDSPVSGGPSRAEAGTLTIMASGAADDIALVRPVLDTIGSTVFVIGARPGMGQAIKLINNIIGATTLAVTCEAVGLAASLGIDTRVAVEVINVSSGRSEVSESKFPRHVLSGAFSFGALGSIMLKDVELYNEMSRSIGAMSHLISERTSEVWRAFVEARPEADMMEIYRYFQSGSHV